VAIGGVTAFNGSLTAVALAAGALGKFALAVASGEQIGCFNGGAIAGAAGAGVPAASTALRFGHNVANSSYWNGYIESVEVYNQRLANAQLQARTVV
jgi:hypothetical protein